MNEDGAKTIEIRIRKNGKIYFSELPEDLLEVAAVLNPEDKSIARRLRLLGQARGSRDNRDKSRRRQVTRQKGRHE